MGTLSKTIGLLALLLATAQAVHSREYNESVPPICNFEYNVDYEGNDINKVPNRPVTSCNEECAAVQGCKAWSWKDNVCYLKSGRATTVAKDGVISSQYWHLLQYWCYPIQCNTDYVDHDIANVQEPNYTNCCRHCFNNQNCHAWSWSNHNGGTCWLKSGKGATVNKAGVISSTRVQV